MIIDGLTCDLSHMEEAERTAAASRLEASMMRQLGFKEAAAHHLANAKAAERWMVRCAHALSFAEARPHG